MTTNDFRVPATDCITSDKPTMREIRRPTLCVIDENGCEITPDENLNTWTGGSNLENHGSALNCPVNGYYNKDCNDNVTAVENNNYLSPSADEDLTELKATADRLKLSTRRQSTVAWQQEYLHSKNNRISPKFDASKLCEHKDDVFTEERKNRINEALAWLKTELSAQHNLLQQTMRKEDEILARRLLSIRHDIHQLKLQRSCKEHQDMLDDVTEDMEETHELHGISDFPLPDSVHDTPLRQLGVTKMHLSARRFSTC